MIVSGRQKYGVGKCRAVTIAGIVFVLLTCSAQADVAAKLQDLLKPVQSLSADFEQNIYASDGYVIQQTEGRLTLSRPGRLRWISRAPFEQWVIGDGETLWIYDPDLEQVSVRPFLKDISKTPAILLIGEMENLSAEYAVKLSQDEKIQTFSLSPKNDTGLYQQVILVFDDTVPVAMTLVDALGQRTEIRFLNVVVNPQVSPEQFSFHIPEGVDVLKGS